MVGEVVLVGFIVMLLGGTAPWFGEALDVVAVVTAVDNGAALSVFIVKIDSMDY